MSLTSNNNNHTGLKFYTSIMWMLLFVGFSAVPRELDNLVYTRPEKNTIIVYCIRDCGKKDELVRGRKCTSFSSRPRLSTETVIIINCI